MSWDVGGEIVGGEMMDWLTWGSPRMIAMQRLYNSVVMNEGTI